MTGFLKNRTLHCQAPKVLVRRGRWLLGNFTQFSIIEKLQVPGLLHNPAGSDPGTQREVLREGSILEKKEEAT